MPQSPEAVVREWFEQVWNQGREEAILRLMAPGGVVHGLTGPGGAPMTGAAAFKTVFYVFREAFDDLHITIEKTVTEGDTCAVFCRVQGRHTGQALGGPPTGRPVDFTGMTLTRVQNGQLVEGWNVFDFLTMYQQIGWAPHPMVP